MLTAIHKIEEQGDHKEQEHDYFKLADDFKSTFSTRDCKPWFVGLWDTVSSIGWYENPLRLPYSANNPDIEIGRHAVSIDERRAFFRSNFGSQKALESRVAQRITSNRFGFPACIATSAVGIQKVKAVFRTLRLSGCSKRQSTRV